METSIQQLTQAEENCLRVAEMVKKVHYDMLELGELLWENRKYAYWSASGFAGFKEFVQTLPLSYDWCTRMADLIDVMKQGLLSREEIIRLGVGKACLLLPHVKKGALTDDIRSVAENGTWNDLRLTLGHNLTEPQDMKEYIHCPHCGEEIHLQPGMIERR